MKRYNSPPNWPTPPQGWQPPPGWQPDPEWGPPPPGHEFWIADSGVSGQFNQRGKALAITALSVSGVALLLCWIPVVNNLVFILGLVAVVLALVASVVTMGAQSSFRGMAIAAVAVSILSVVGVLASQAYYRSVISDAFGISEDETRQRPTAITSESHASPSGNSSESDAGTAARPFPLGTTASMGPDYEVAVVGVKLDATAEVLAANRFNNPPEGQYVLVQLHVKYVGVGEGNPWLDLSPTFVGTDARQYDAHECNAVLAQGAMDVPTLETGGAAGYQVCMDVPEGAANGAKVFVERRLSFSDKTRAYWALS